MTEWSVEALTKAYVKLRDERTEKKKAYDEGDFKLVGKMEQIELQLMQRLKGAGVTSFSTPFGTVFTTTETKYTCADWNLYWGWMYENQRLDCVEKRVSQGAMKALEEENESLPPAIEVHREKVVRVRRG